MKLFPANHVSVFVADPRKILQAIYDLCIYNQLTLIIVFILDQNSDVF